MVQFDCFLIRKSISTGSAAPDALRPFTADVLLRYSFYVTFCHISNSNLLFMPNIYPYFDEKFSIVTSTGNNNSNILLAFVSPPLRSKKSINQNKIFTFINIPHHPMPIINERCIL